MPVFIIAAEKISVLETVGMAKIFVHRCLSLSISLYLSLSRAQVSIYLCLHIQVSIYLYLHISISVPEIVGMAKGFVYRCLSLSYKLN